MATLTQSQSNLSSTSSMSTGGPSSAYSSSPASTTSSSCKGGGILANAHEAPKKPIKAADSSFTSALKNAFLLPQPGKQMKHTGKPLGKSFRRTSPLPTVGHEGGEVLKRDPRGDNAQVGDGVVLPSDEDYDPEGEGEEEIESVSEWDSSASSTGGDTSAPESDWTSEHYARGRSNTASTEMSRSMSRSSQTSSNNPCIIKFAPLPSSGRLKRANSITIGVAARSHLLQSQGSARTADNTAAWQAQANVQRQQAQNTSNRPQGSSGSNGGSKQQGAVRYSDTVDLGEELRKGMLKAFRKVRKGGSVSEGSSTGDEKDATIPKKETEAVQEEEDLYELAGEKTPKRSASPLRMSSHSKDDVDEADGTQTPRHNLQRRLSTGAFTGNNSLLEIEEKRKKGLTGEGDKGNEEIAQFAEQMGQTHASRVAHHMGEDKWHSTKEMKGVEDGGEATSITSVESVYSDAADDTEAMEAERLANESLKSHSAKATKAGAIEKMEHRH